MPEILAIQLCGDIVVTEWLAVSIVKHLCALYGKGAMGYWESPASISKSSRKTVGSVLEAGLRAGRQRLVSGRQGSRRDRLRLPGRTHREGPAQGLGLRTRRHVSRQRCSAAARLDRAFRLRN
jgi:hypothetical protein